MKITKYLSTKKLKEFFVQTKRTLHVAKKPTKEELKKTLRICGIGFVVVGLIGFALYLVSMLGIIALGF